MRLPLATILFGLSTPLAAVAQEAARPEVTAATAAARGNLRAAIDATPVARDVTVRQVVDRAGDDAPLAEAVRGARQIGGPRWIDEQTCQVRLDLAGDAVARAVAQVAAVRPDASPLSPADLRDALADWPTRTFTATGTGTTGAAAAAPSTTAAAGAPTLADPPPWVGTLLDADGRAAFAGSRLRTVRAAEAVALAKLRAQVESFPAANARSVADLVSANPSLDAALRSGLAQRRITKVEYEADGAVSVRVSLDGHAVWRALAGQ